MKISTDKLNATAVILTIAFGVFILLVVRHQAAVMKSGGCTTCGGTVSEPDPTKAIQDLFNMPLHVDDSRGRVPLWSSHGLTVAQIRGDGQL